MEENKVSIYPIADNDLDTLAELHVTAFQGHTNVLFGKRYAKAFLHWFSTQENTIALVIKRNNIPMGYVVGAPNGYQKAMNKALLHSVIICTLLKPWLIFHKKVVSIAWLKLKTLLKKEKTLENEQPDINAMSLVGIAIGNKAQGMGLGQKLMIAFENETRKKAMHLVRLSVYASNSKARKLYEKCGWSPDNEGNVLNYIKAI